ERERQRALLLVVGLRLDDLAEGDELANLVRYLEADVRLAGDHLDDAHTDRRKRAGEILRQVRDLADLDPRRRLQLEARDDGPGLHGDDLDLNAEVGELQLDEP